MEVLLTQTPFLGDSVLHFLALEYKPEQPTEWLQKHGSNKFLAKIFVGIKGHGKFVGFPGYKRKHTKATLAVRHHRATWVESWLGEAYQRGGLDDVIATWERMMVIIDYKGYKSHFDPNKNTIVK